jgi:serine/threonine-protein kinase
MEHPLRVGKYTVEAFIGGGMSRVYRARDAVLGRTVALKILTDLGASDGVAKERFLQEARIASNISHENVIAVYDFGEDNGRPFMVMEYLEGESLREAMRAGRAGDFRRKLEIALQLARAIEFIHSKKIVHRDIKPENVHVDRAGRATLMDFGIAKSEDVALTRIGTTLGTPFYMAPEQVTGQPATAQTDVYAFGVVLYELLTGVRPVHGDRIEQVFQQILYQPAPVEPLEEANVPPLVVDMITRCMAKAPAQRPQGLAAVCGQIETLLSHHSPDNAMDFVPAPETQSNSRGRAEAPAADSSNELPESDDLPEWMSKLPAPLQTHSGLIALGAAGVAAIGAVIAIVLRVAHII